ISHKLLRLAVPVALAALLIAAPLLKAPFYKVVFLTQVIFYALSLISLARLLKQGILARVADAAGDFVLLDGAAVGGLVSFLFRGSVRPGGRSDVSRPGSRKGPEGSFMISERTPRTNSAPAASTWSARLRSTVAPQARRPMVYAALAAFAWLYYYRPEDFIPG